MHAVLFRKHHPEVLVEKRDVVRNVTDPSQSAPHHAFPPASPKHLHELVSSVHDDCVSQDTVQDNVHS